MTESLQLWSSYGLRVTTAGPTGSVVTEIDRPFARVGAHSLSDVRLAKGTADKRAIYFHATQQGVFYVDLAECDRGLGRRGWLPPGGDVEIGVYRLSAELTIGGQLAQAPEPSEQSIDLCGYDADESSYPNFEIGYKGQKISEVGLRRPLSLVGRRPPCALRIREGHVSTCHGVFYWRDETLWFIDLFSGNGSLLNGRPVDAARVRVGDRIDLGSAELLFTEIAPAHRVGRRQRVDALEHRRTPLEDESHQSSESTSTIQLDVGTIEGETTLSASKRAELVEKSPAVEDSLPGIVAKRPAWKPFVEPDSSESLPASESDHPDEGLAYVVGRLAEREKKNHRRQATLRWLAAALVFALAAAAIAAATIFKITRSA